MLFGQEIQIAASAAIFLRVDFNMVAKSGFAPRSSLHHIGLAATGQEHNTVGQREIQS